MNNDAIELYLESGVQRARAEAPNDDLAFLMRKDLYEALIDAGIVLLLPVWHSDVLPVSFDSDGRKTASVHIYRVTDLEAMRAS